MHCPSCREPLREHSPACPHCGFSLAVADEAFGIPPQLNDDLTDLAGVLSQRDARHLCDALHDAATKFPQVTFAAVITRLPPQIPLPLCAFWLFNRGGLVPPMDSAGACRLLLLVFDADQGRAACMIGYGLEPFVNETVLQRIADAALPALREQDYAQAIRDSLACAGQELAAITQAIPQGFGLSETTGAPVDEAGEVFAY